MIAFVILPPMSGLRCWVVPLHLTKNMCSWMAERFISQLLALRLRNLSQKFFSHSIRTFLQSSSLFGMNFAQRSLFQVSSILSNPLCNSSTCITSSFFTYNSIFLLVYDNLLILIIVLWLVAFPPKVDLSLWLPSSLLFKSLSSSYKNFDSLSLFCG